MNPKKVDRLRDYWLFESLARPELLTFQDLFEHIAENYSPLDVYGKKGLEDWGFSSERIYEEEDGK